LVSALSEGYGGAEAMALRPANCWWLLVEHVFKRRSFRFRGYEVAPTGVEIKRYDEWRFELQ
jgi:hypothetical protein